MFDPEVVLQAGNDGVHARAGRIHATDRQRFLLPITLSAQPRGRHTLLFRGRAAVTHLLVEAKNSNGAAAAAAELMAGLKNQTIHRKAITFMKGGSSCGQQLEFTTKDL